MDNLNVTTKQIVFGFNDNIIVNDNFFYYYFLNTHFNLFYIVDFIEMMWV